MASVAKPSLSSEIQQSHVLHNELGLYLYNINNLVESLSSTQTSPKGLSTAPISLLSHDYSYNKASIPVESTSIHPSLQLSPPGVDRTTSKRVYIDNDSTINKINTNYDSKVSRSSSIYPNYDHNTNLSLQKQHHPHKNSQHDQNKNSQNDTNIHETFINSKHYSHLSSQMYDYASPPYKTSLLNENDNNNDKNSGGDDDDDRIDTDQYKNNDINTTPLSYTLPSSIYKYDNNNIIHSESFYKDQYNKIQATLVKEDNNVDKIRCENAYLRSHCKHLEHLLDISSQQTNNNKQDDVENETYILTLKNKITALIDENNILKQDLYKYQSLSSYNTNKNYKLNSGQCLNPLHIIQLNELQVELDELRIIKGHYTDILDKYTKQTSEYNLLSEQYKELKYQYNANLIVSHSNNNHHHNIDINNNNSNDDNNNNILHDLYTQNVYIIQENKTLHDDNKRLKENNITLYNDNIKLNDENIRLHNDNISINTTYNNIKHLYDDLLHKHEQQQQQQQEQQQRENRQHIHEYIYNSNNNNVSTIDTIQALLHKEIIKMKTIIDQYTHHTQSLPSSLSSSLPISSPSLSHSSVLSPSSLPSSPSLNLCHKLSHHIDTMQSILSGDINHTNDTTTTTTTATTFTPQPTTISFDLKHNSHKNSQYTTTTSTDTPNSNIATTATTLRTASTLPTTTPLICTPVPPSHSYDNSNNTTIRHHNSRIDNHNSRIDNINNDPDIESIDVYNHPIYNISHTHNHINSTSTTTMKQKAQYTTPTLPHPQHHTLHHTSHHRPASVSLPLPISPQFPFQSSQTDHLNSVSCPTSPFPPPATQLRQDTSSSSRRLLEQEQQPQQQGPKQQHANQSPSVGGVLSDDALSSSSPLSSSVSSNYDSNNNNNNTNQSHNDLSRLITKIKELEKRLRLQDSKYIQLYTHHTTTVRQLEAQIALYDYKISL